MLHFGIIQSLFFNRLFDQIVVCSDSNEYWFVLEKEKRDVVLAAVETYISTVPSKYKGV
jgi:hypothetical protein